MDRAHATVIHRICVLLDDYLCEQFSFSRNGDGAKASFPTHRQRWAWSDRARDVAIVLHKCLVVYDDYLCHRYGLNRQAR